MKFKKFIKKINNYHLKMLETSYQDISKVYAHYNEECATDKFLHEIILELRERWEKKT
jgi:hypothetical protein